MGYITGDYSSLFLQTCLPMLGPGHLWSLVTTLLSGLRSADLDTLANHWSTQTFEGESQVSGGTDQIAAVDIILEFYFDYFDFKWLSTFIYLL